MCVHVHVCMSVRVRARTCVCQYVCVHMSVHVRARTCVCVCACEYVCACAYVCACIVYMRACVYDFVCMCVRALCTCVCVRTYVYVCVRVCARTWYVCAYEGIEDALPLGVFSAKRGSTSRYLSPLEALMGGLRGFPGLSLFMLKIYSLTPMQYTVYVNRLKMGKEKGPERDHVTIVELKKGPPRVAVQVLRPQVCGGCSPCQEALYAGKAYVGSEVCSAGV